MGFLPSPTSQKLHAVAIAPTTGEATQRFGRTFPPASVVCYAWSILVDLAMIGCGEPESAAHIGGALLWYERRLLRWSIDHTIVWRASSPSFVSRSPGRWIHLGLSS